MNTDSHESELEDSFSDEPVALRRRLDEPFCFDEPDYDEERTNP